MCGKYQKGRQNVKTPNSGKRTRGGGKGGAFTLAITTSLFFYTFIFLLVFNLPTYRITPSAHPVKCPPQCLSPSHPHPHPPPLPPPLVRFPELGVFHVLSLFLIFPTYFFLLSPLFPFTIFYIPPMNETI